MPSRNKPVSEEEREQTLEEVKSLLEEHGEPVGETNLAYEVHFVPGEEERGLFRRMRDRIREFMTPGVYQHECDNPDIKRDIEPEKPPHLSGLLAASDRLRVDLYWEGAREEDEEKSYMIPNSGPATANGDFIHSRLNQIALKEEIYAGRSSLSIWYKTSEGTHGVTGKIPFMASKELEKALEPNQENLEAYSSTDIPDTDRDH